LLLETPGSAVECRVILMHLGYPLFVRLTHGFNILFLSLMLRSGMEILSSFPKLYLNDHCRPGSEWLRLSSIRTPRDRPWISLEEEVTFPAVVSLPGNRELGLARHWHFAVAAGWLLTGLVYVVLLFTSDEWPRLVPTSWSVLPQAWEALRTYLSFHLPPDGNPYNPLQQLAYFAVVFILAPVQIVTGLAMSPAFSGRFPWYLRFLGGKQVARSAHFVGLCLFSGFLVVHTAMVLVHGLPNEMSKMVLGSDRAGLAPALGVGLGGIGLILLINVGATLLSRRRPRDVQHALGVLLDPMQRLLSRLRSHQHYRIDDITPTRELWVNGYPPEGNEYADLRVGAFKDYRLEVHGLVENPLSLSLDDLRALERQDQVTKHHCIQGWTGVAAWAGAPFQALEALCVPKPSAQYAVFYSFDDKSTSGNKKEKEVGGGLFYEAVALTLLRAPQSILAYELNAEPLPVEHGAPLRLRVEAQLGFKMVKWIRAIEFIDDYGQIGVGQGGWREDHAYYSNQVGV
jgi:DMSO/TMAO reductase YedYZ molybdopterin-dependent catalytic subunit/thiosulfate reductase cytochrome b subunit